MSQPILYDNHGRPLTYLRLAVTDRCNLRCFYCMPESGIKFLPRDEVLSYEEMLRLTNLLVEMGITKIRITGGEPFVKKDLIFFLEELAKSGVDLHITTNGVLTEQYVPKLKAIGVKSINLSLDTLDKKRFAEITRRDELEAVMSCFHSILEHDIDLKINMVVMKDNLQDIIPMAQLIEQYPVNVRLIEEMPFNGSEGFKPSLSHNEILEKIKTIYPSIAPLKNEYGETATSYQVENLSGTIGIIPAFSRTFCGSCNRIRITAKGELKNCLYDRGVLDLKEMLRNNSSDETIRQAFLKAFGSRAKNGFEAEKMISQTATSRESMSSIGG